MRASVRTNPLTAKTMATLDLSPLWLSLKLSFVTTLLLLAVCVPFAWWLATTGRRRRILVSSLSTLPLVLPPSVLGFYMLLFLGSQSPLAPVFNVFGVQTLAFSFSGLVIASMVYSLPFVLQPITTAFASIGRAPLEAAASLRASPLNTFVHVVIPLGKPAIISAAVLGFAHTMGEFGVILMIGGSIPEETRVLSIAIYEHVEALEYAQAHWLAGIMLGFSFIVLFSVYWFNYRLIRLPADTTADSTQ